MSKELRRQVRQNLAHDHLRRLSSLGQNFLVDYVIINRACQVIRETSPDELLEIGPGLGAVTIPLALAKNKVVAVELDRGLANRLVKIVPGNVQVIRGNIFDQNLSGFGFIKHKYVAFGSLPFNMGTAIIQFLLENECPPRQIYAILQQEVIDRILANNKKQSILSLAVRFYGSARFRFRIPASAYEPAPRVKTGLISIDCTPGTPLLEFKDPFFKLIKAGFSARRKYLVSNLAKKLDWPKKQAEKALRECRLGTKSRAEELSFQNWLDLTKNYLTYLG